MVHLACRLATSSFLHLADFIYSFWAGDDWRCAGPLNQDEHFIVWMRTSALANFRKLWGRIDTDLPKGSSVTVSIANRYNTYKFDGQKHVVLSTTSWLGGSNKFLGIAYVVVGGISFLCGLLFFVVQWQYPRQRGDVAYLSWNANGNSLASGM